jgi:hypothetical protein
MKERNEPMNEMKLLEDMCAAVPPPDADSLAAVRARVLGDVGRAPAGPARPGRSHRGGGRRPALSRPRLVLAAGVAVAVAAAVVVAGGLPFGGGSVLVTSASAAQVLQRAAVAALSEPVPRDGQFVYTEITGNEGIFTAPGSPATVRERIWQSADGSSAGTIEAVPCVMLTPGTDNAPSAGLLTPGQRTPPPPLSRCELAIRLGHDLPPVASYAGLRTLPAEPGALLAYIHAHVRAAQFFDKDTGARLTWDAIVQILRDDVAVPPKLAAAIFRAAATLPGTVVLPHVVDAAGRPGIAVAMQEFGLSTELIFDPHTYRFTGSAEVVTSSGEDTGSDRIGTIFFAMAVLRTAITSTAPVVPASDTYVFQPSTIGDFSR